IGGQGQSEQYLLLDIVGLGGSSCRARTRGTLHRQHGAVTGEAAQARQHEIQRSHVRRLLLYPHDVSRVWVTLKFGSELMFREGVELVYKSDCNIGDLLPLALGAQFMTDLAATQKNAPGIGDVGIVANALERRAGEFCDWRRGVRMSEHALGREHDQGLAPCTQCLASQEMEVLRGTRRLADLNIVECGELQKPLDARTGMLGALALVSVGEQHHQSGKQAPL